PVDNDRGFGNWIAKDWKNQKLDTAKVVVIKPLSSVVNDDGTVIVTVSTENRCANGSIKTDYSYTMDSEGNVDFTAIYTPEGELPPLPCLGNTFVLPKTISDVSWYGMGPLDNYPDRLEAASIKRWCSSISEQYVHYARPQDSGNHEQVAEVTLSDVNGKDVYTITAEDDTPFSFSVLPYSVEQLYNTKHDCDLIVENNVYLNIDAAVLGLGNSSCGPGVLTKYTIPQEKHELHIRFSKK
ncbi:MAG: beta-galactosidase small subunit, partial [Prevotella sp.]|nr:beta-galactosidase small subunit [Prevotella sp.]